MENSSKDYNEIRQAIKNMPLEEKLQQLVSSVGFGEDNSVKNALGRAGLKTLGDIVALSPKRLKAVRSIGEKAESIILPALDEMGLRLAENAPSAHISTAIPVIAKSKKTAAEDLEINKTLPLEELLQRGIETLHLPAIAQNKLLRLGVEKIEDIKDLTAADLKNVPGIGKDSVKMLINAQKELGLNSISENKASPDTALDEAVNSPKGAKKIPDCRKI